MRHRIVLGIGIVLVLAGLLCNEWLLGRFLSAGDQPSRADRFLVWLAGFSLTGVGVLLLVFRRRVPLAGLVATALTLLVGLTVAEWVLRSRPVPSSSELFRQSVPYVPSAFSSSRMAPGDHDLRWRPDGGEPSLRAILRGGYRGERFEARKPEGQVRIVVLGGSFVFDGDSGAGNDWPRVAQDELRAAGHGTVRVVNAGTPGHTTFDSLGRLNAEIHYLAPDYVLLCHSWNDIKYFPIVSPERTPLQFQRTLTEPTHPDRVPGLLRWLEGFQLYLQARALPARWGRKAGFEGYLPEGTRHEGYGEWGPRQFGLNLRHFVDICRNVGTVPVLCTQPRLPRRGSPEEARAKVGYEWVRLDHATICDAFDDCDRQIRGVAGEKSAALVELAAAVPPDVALFKDHVHLLPEGSRRVGAAVAQALRGLLDGAK